jgi:hypothetical protein
MEKIIFQIKELQYQIRNIGNLAKGAVNDLNDLIVDLIPNISKVIGVGNFEVGIDSRGVWVKESTRPCYHIIDATDEVLDIIGRIDWDAFFSEVKFLLELNLESKENQLNILGKLISLLTSNEVVEEEVKEL